MSKKARERRHEEEKANKALGGARLKETAKATVTKHYIIELHWFKLLRGTRRLEQIASIFLELAPQKIFDPRGIYNAYMKDKIRDVVDQEEGGDDTAASASAAGKTKKEKPKKLSKKEQIIAENTARLQKEAALKDAEKLRTLGNKAKADLKLSTETGKLMLLLQNLKDAVKEKYIIDVLDTLWEVEELTEDELKGDESAIAAMKQYSDTIKEARRMRSEKALLGGKHIVDYQLTEMSDRLPPLNLHALQGKFHFDSWQLKVIEHIENRKSVLITAPTSSGKTVLSTYVCTTNARVLFVVPIEPLAWQVAAMIRALKLGVALVISTLNFVPPQWDVCIGTPIALESTLTTRIGFDFDWAIFDEVHSLNNSGGDALQRIIRSVPSSCKFLALSATIGNAIQLKDWWETIVGKGNIELVQHRARFINLQRQVWTGGIPGAESTKDSKTESNLHLLHPCVCINAEFLRDNGFGSTDMALTPIDSYKLWRAFDKNVGKLETPPIKIKDLRPRTYFKSGTEEGDQEKNRITLAQACEYERALKERLELLAKTDIQLTQRLLISLGPKKQSEASASSRRRDEDEDDGAVETGAVVDTSSLAANLSAIMSASAKADTPLALYELCFEMQRKNIVPAIVFQLDSVRCQSYFEALLQMIELKEEQTYPNYREQLLEERRGIEKLSAQAAKGQRKRVDEEEEMIRQQFGENLDPDSVDVDAPHPDFCLTPPGRGMGSTETLEIQKKLHIDLHPHGNLPHPLIRALRRGIGVYINGLPNSYHRVVQTFAQKGRLGIVFSDELLAYGVNMPFRTAVFFGDPGSSWLTPLLHQQMAGRAGRRGLDRQGHLIYCGFKPDRLQELLRGELPDVKGAYPLYPTIPLQLAVHQKYEFEGVSILDESLMIRMCSQTLNEFIENGGIKETDNGSNYYNDATLWINELKIMDPNQSTGLEIIPELVWELRIYLPESIAIQYLLDPIILKYRFLQIGGNDAIMEQYEIMRIFCRICCREPYDPSLQGVMDGYGPLPAPHKQDDEWSYWTNLIDRSQSRIKNVTSLNQVQKAQLLLPHWKQKDAIELSNDVYIAFVQSRIDPALPTALQHKLRGRLWTTGNILLITSNILVRFSELSPIQNLIRKCFLRIRYILDETFERNWKAVGGRVLLDMPSLEDDDGEEESNIPE